MIDTRTDKIEGDILIIDDDRHNLQTLSSILVEQGYEIRGAQNGKAALTFIDKEPPDLILLDIRMPEMDGYEVCDELKKNKETENIPVIFLTGKDAKSDEGRSFQVGADMYIKKPFSCDRLLEIVRIVLMSINK